MVVADDLCAGEAVVVHERAQRLRDLCLLRGGEHAGRIRWVVVLGLILEPYLSTRTLLLWLDEGTNLNADGEDSDALALVRLQRLE